MRINTNTASLMAQEANTNTNKKLTTSLEKLSTGLRINKASDDASGLAIADKLRTQASSIGQSISNGNSAVSLTQIADKAMAEQSNILNTIKTKLIQAATDTSSDEGREAIGKDINKLLDQLNNIAKQTNYNGTTLLQGATSGSAAVQLTFQMGETSSDTIQTGAGVRANVSGLSLEGLKSAANSGTVSSFSAAKARSFMKTVDSALNTLNSWRADFGSTQNQLESAIRNQMTQQTNIKAAESVIRDVDYAQESANFNKQNIISQAGTFAMSQANNVQQNILRLLQ
ncbi:flagellin [Malaciobacter molluscorum LMG 25693]|uniref:Flagellin n=1 Tax=Malaciobacter molluscorum LMG 25693 TaxID=870501 RepID=A0A2G1DES1_9BACT|nr:flagellin [Malaciobacter molluscorum]AXX93538.1 flagellin [Malaciobacter molluscorum LMG 25693]PHO16998.1 flagellin [Malaciobacter molluscorum LMG 25693]